MLLYFLRHGDACQDAHISDTKRPLTDLGIHQAVIVRSYLQRMQLKIAAVFSSPLTRAQQTASIIQEKITAQQSDISEYLLNGTDQKQLFEQLNSLNASSVLLVGHEPHLSETISLLISGNQDAGIEMKKCSLVLVEIRIPIQEGHGELLWLINQDIMKKLIQE